MHSIDLKNSAIYSYKYIITSRVYSNKTTQSFENVKNQITEEYENSDLGSDSFSAIQDKNIKCLFVSAFEAQKAFFQKRQPKIVFGKYKTQLFGKSCVLYL